MVLMHRVGNERNDKMSNLSQKKGYKSHLVKKAAVALTVFTMASAGVVAIDSAHSEDAYAATALKKTSV